MANRRPEGPPSSNRVPEEAKEFQESGNPPKFANGYRVEQFAEAPTNSQYKTTHTLPHSKKGERCEKVWALSLSSQGRPAPIHEQTFLQHCESFVRCKRKQPKLDTNSTRHSTRSSSPSTSNVENFKDLTTDNTATESSDQATNSTGELVAWSVDRSTAAYGGHFLPLGRRLARHGGHLQDGKRGECIFFRFRLQAMAIPMEATGGANTTQHRARFTTSHNRNIFSRVAQDCFRCPGSV